MIPVGGCPKKKFPKEISFFGKLFLDNVTYRNYNKDKIKIKEFFLDLHVSIRNCVLFAVSKGGDVLDKNRRMRALLRQRGMSITELAKLVGVKHSHISNIIAGRRKPSVDLALKISQVLHVTVNDLMRKGDSNVQQQPAASAPTLAGGGANETDG